MKSTKAKVLDNKQHALEYFVNYLLDSDIKKYLAKVILFGSVAQGLADKESDIDVLVFTTGAPEKVAETCAEAAMWAGIEMKESVEPLIRCIDKLYNGQSYFLRKALLEGEVVYSMESNELARKGAQSFHDLSQEFSDAADYNLKGGYFRGAVDSAYNALELSIKGLLVLKMDDLPKTHGGNDARYDLHASIDKEKADEVIQLSKTLLEILENKLSD